MPKNKNHKKDTVNIKPSMQDLFNQGRYEEAQTCFENDWNSDWIYFLESYHIDKQTHERALTFFLKDKEFPWHFYLNRLIDNHYGTSQYPLNKLVPLLKQHNVDFWKESKEGKGTLFDRIYHSVKTTTRNFHEFGFLDDYADLIQQDFLKKGAESIIFDKKYYWNNYRIDSDAIPYLSQLLTILNTPSICHSKTYQSLLEQPNRLTSTLLELGQNNFNTLLNNEFFNSSDRDRLSSTYLLRLFSSSSFSHTDSVKIKQAINNNLFCPVWDLLDESTQKTLSGLLINNVFSLKTRSDELPLIFTLLKNQMIPLKEGMENYILSSFIEDNLSVKFDRLDNYLMLDDIFDKNDLLKTKYQEHFDPLLPKKHIEKIISSVEKIKQMGFSLNSVYKMEDYQQMINTYLKHNIPHNNIVSQDKITSDISEISKALDIPPSAVDLLLKILDKRYNLEPKSDAIVEKTDRDIILEQWNDFISQFNYVTSDDLTRSRKSKFNY